MTNTPSSNKAVFEKALSDYYSVYLAISCHTGVIMPNYLKTTEWLAGNSVVRLEYGLDMAVPITDMEITNDGVKATLSFARELHRTYVPWEAVRYIACGDERPPAPKPRPKLGLVK